MTTLLCKGTYVEGHHAITSEHAMVLGFTKQGLCTCGSVQLREMDGCLGGWKETGNTCDACDGKKAKKEEVKVDSVVLMSGQDDAVIALGPASVDNSQYNPISTNVANVDYEDSNDEVKVDDVVSPGDGAVIALGPASVDNSSSINIDDDAKKAFFNYIASLTSVAQKAEKKLEEEELEHAATKKKLEEEEKTHAATKKSLEESQLTGCMVVEAHAALSLACSATKKLLLKKEACLCSEKKAHATTQKKLDEEKVAGLRRNTAYLKAAAEAKTAEGTHSARLLLLSSERNLHASTKKKLEEEKVAHAATQKEEEQQQQLWMEAAANVRDLHLSTKKKLEEEKVAHAATQKLALDRATGHREQAKAAKELQAVTKKKLEEEKLEHAATQKKLRELPFALELQAATQKKLEGEKEAHAATKKKLEGEVGEVVELRRRRELQEARIATEEKAHAATKNKLEAEKEKDAEMNKMLSAIMKVSDEKIGTPNPPEYLHPAIPRPVQTFVCPITTK